MGLGDVGLPVRGCAALALTLALAPAALGGTVPRGAAYPMVAQDWMLAPDVPWIHGQAAPLAFRTYEGMPDGVMTVGDGMAVSRLAEFGDGVIDFDVKPLAYDDTGIVFRRHDGSGEFFYLRGNPDCPAADDCYQYAPIVRDHMMWDTYAEYQGSAAISPAGWNHVHIVVAGAKMEVTLNHAPLPTLVVPKLQSPVTEGSIGFKGPAEYANLVVRPYGDADALARVQADAPEPGAVMDWLAAAPTPWTPGQAISAADVPAGGWKVVPVEANGLVNLNREFNVARISTGWLKARISRGVAARRMLHLGFRIQATVFLNGAVVYRGENPYRPVEKRLSPDGRLEADNAVIPLDLRAGVNEIVVAIGNAWMMADGRLEASPYGWAAEAHLDTG